MAFKVEPNAMGVHIYISIKAGYIPYIAFMVYDIELKVTKSVVGSLCAIFSTCLGGVSGNVKCIYEVVFCEILSKWH